MTILAGNNICPILPRRIVVNLSRNHRYLPEDPSCAEVRRCVALFIKHAGQLPDFLQLPFRAAVCLGWLFRPFIGRSIKPSAECGGLSEPITSWHRSKLSVFRDLARTIDMLILFYAYSAHSNSHEQKQGNSTPAVSRSVTRLHDHSQ